jgi:hypothetical protein
MGNCPVFSFTGILRWMRVDRWRVGLDQLEFRLKEAKDVDDTTRKNMPVRTSSLNTGQKSGGHPSQQRSTIDCSSFQSSFTPTRRAIRFCSPTEIQLPQHVDPNRVTHHQRDITHPPPPQKNVGIRRLVPVVLLPHNSRRLRRIGTEARRVRAGVRERGGTRGGRGGGGV